MKPVTITITPTSDGQYDIEITGGNGRVDKLHSTDGILGVRGRVGAWVDNLHLYVEPKPADENEGADQNKVQQQQQQQQQ